MLVARVLSLCERKDERKNFFFVSRGGEASISGRNNQEAYFTRCCVREKMFSSFELHGLVFQVPGITGRKHKRSIANICRCITTG